MICIHCGNPTQVVNSRLLKRQNQVWRRRKCTVCEAIFTTHEVAQYSAAWLVQSTGDALAPFSRDKLLISIHRSCQHRPDALSDAANLADTVISKLLPLASTGPLETKTIAHITQVALNRFDIAASVHYAAFHTSK
jgi:transcriptional regulator NrdR family protein